VENIRSKLCTEQHYKPEQVAKLWAMSGGTIRRLFEHETGVIVIDRPEKMHKRGYKSMRIPESVVARVHAQLNTK
jgi:hypothetical protein